MIRCIDCLYGIQIPESSTVNPNELHCTINPEWVPVTQDHFCNLAKKKKPDGLAIEGEP